MLTFKEGVSSKKDVVAYWHVYAGHVRIGYAYISKSTSGTVGDHFSINVFVNKAFQRKGFGQVIFKEVSALSGYEVLYAHSSKGNAGSYHAALKAGYKEVESDDFRQRIMVWKK